MEEDMILEEQQEVALRKESVDRKSIGPANFRVSTVALRKESVDRKHHAPGF